MQGMTVNDLIKELQMLRANGHGEKEVVAGGTDYPGGASGVYINTTENSYKPKGCVCISNYD